MRLAPRSRTLVSLPFQTNPLWPSMSLRPRDTSSSGASDGKSNADEIRRMIEGAKLANESFFLSNPHLADSEGTNPIGAPPTRVQRLAEMGRPFRLTIEQKLEESTIEKGRWTAKVTIELSNGVFARLRDMMNSISSVFEPLFQKSGFKIRMQGTLYKVCSRPDQSTVEWAFQKELTGDLLAKAQKGDYQFWVLPNDKKTPFALLKSLLNDNKSIKDPNGVINDTKYQFAPLSKSTMGKMAVFELKLL